MSDFEKTRCEADIDDNPHSHYTNGSIDEDAYRRGFQQGVEITMKAVRDGVPDKRLKRWQDAVYRWRFLRSHKKRTPPPLPHVITRRERIAYNQRRATFPSWLLRVGSASNERAYAADQTTR